jgi:hypothetical protein
MVASTFTQALFDKICELIADGKSVREIVEMKGMPSRATFRQWHMRTPELQAQYDRACLDREEVYFEQIIAIADDTSHDTIATEKNGEQMNSEWVTRSRLRIDARKWTLARMNRKKYGDHITEELTGPNGGPLQVVRLRMAPVEELPE